jgi:uncharacterized repeat protein (TIGR03803 family)
MIQTEKGGTILSTSLSMMAALLVFEVYALAQAPMPTLRTIYNFTGGSDGSLPAAGVTVSAGALYGTTLNGGIADYGTVYSLTRPAAPGGAWTETTLYDFTGGDDGAYPAAGVTMGAHGILYGATGGPGSLNTFGAVYSLTPPTSSAGSWTETTLFSFSGPLDGEKPFASLAIGGAPDAEPVLYGTTVTGGGCPANLWGCGTAFAVTESGAVWTEAVLHYFDHDAGQPEADGIYPNGIVLGGDGVLVGTTSSGGTNGAGTVFLLRRPASPGGWVETAIYNFADGGAEGANPAGSVAFGEGGVLYGTTEFGGASGAGTVFSLTPPAVPGGAWTERVLYSFAGGSDGQAPIAGVAIGPGGVLYGTTFQGGIRNATCAVNGACGTVFSLTPPASPTGGWTKTTLHSFTGGSDGYGPYAGVSVAEGGMLFGTTEFGGACSSSAAGCGTVFELEL